MIYIIGLIVFILSGPLTHAASCSSSNEDRIEDYLDDAEDTIEFEIEDLNLRRSDVEIIREELDTHSRQDTLFSVPAGRYTFQLQSFKRNFDKLENRVEEEEEDLDNLSRQSRFEDCDDEIDDAVDEFRDYYRDRLEDIEDQIDRFEDEIEDAGIGTRIISAPTISNSPYSNNRETRTNPSTSDIRAPQIGSQQGSVQNDSNNSQNIQRTEQDVFNDIQNLINQIKELMVELLQLRISKLNN